MAVYSRSPSTVTVCDWAPPSDQNPNTNGVPARFCGDGAAIVVVEPGDAGDTLTMPSRLAGSAGKGGNFVETMLRLAREGNPIRVVGDQVTAPTNTAEIAEALLPLIREGVRGVVHLAASEGCSWHDFAAEIFRLADVAPPLEAVTTEEFGGPVKRPMYSVLRSTRGAELGHWRDGLARYMREKHGISR